ncbi:MAG: hypothetical protein JO362_17765 [Streptomycetaceae bacterium]|nr:hypothetical protein [Streptomycetaceae bacterium]
MLNADAETITSYDQDEFAAIRWLTVEQVLDEPLEILDRYSHVPLHPQAAPPPQPASRITAGAPVMLTRRARIGG